MNTSFPKTLVLLFSFSHNKTVMKLDRYNDTVSDIFYFCPIKLES